MIERGTTGRGNAKGQGLRWLVTGLVALSLDAAAAAQDRYASFTDLRADAREGVDFEVISRDVGASITVLAIHGGTIEPGTDIVARAIAGPRFNLYVFRAIRPGSGADLHVTSTHFDDPRAVKMVSGSAYAVSVHGEGGSEEPAVCVGGGNGALRDRVALHLQDLVRVENPCQRLSGASPANIVNRAGKQGVQLELAPSLRGKLQGDPVFLEQFANAVRAAVLSF